MGQNVTGIDGGSIIALFQDERSRQVGSKGPFMENGEAVHRGAQEGRIGKRRKNRPGRHPAQASIGGNHLFFT
jgi:hypothetical protein